MRFIAWGIVRRNSVRKCPSGARFEGAEWTGLGRFGNYVVDSMNDSRWDGMRGMKSGRGEGGLLRWR